MPWCDACDRFYNPNTLRADGSCPECGRVVGDAATVVAEEESPPVPWHFKLLVGSVVVYLGWRLVQGIDWVAHHL